MPKIIELVWFHMKPDETEAKINQVLARIKDGLLSTPGLEALYYGIGTTIPQGFTGMNIVKIWSSADAQRAYLKSPDDYEYIIAKEIIDETDPVRPPNSVSFATESTDVLFQALGGAVTLLSCVWLPAGADKKAFETLRSESIARGGRLEELRNTELNAWSVSGSTHPIIGGTDGFLTLWPATDVREAGHIASENKDVVSKLGQFGDVYDQQYTRFSRMM